MNRGQAAVQEMTGRGRHLVRQDLTIQIVFDEVVIRILADHGSFPNAG